VPLFNPDSFQAFKCFLEGFTFLFPIKYFSVKAYLFPHRYDVYLLNLGSFEAVQWSLRSFTSLFPTICFSMQANLFPYWSEVSLLKYLNDSFEPYQ
jgi:hypothetical protein